MLFNYNRKNIVLIILSVTIFVFTLINILIINYTENKSVIKFSTAGLKNPYVTYGDNEDNIVNTQTNNTHIIEIEENNIRKSQTNNTITEKQKNMNNINNKILPITGM